MIRNTITCASAIDFTESLDDNSVDCVVTSPPYFGLRDYGVAGQWGSEDSPRAFIDNLITLFSEIKRALKPSGTVWVNLGDSYSSHRSGKTADPFKKSTVGTRTQAVARANKEAQETYRNSSLAEKSLMMLPARFAIAMCDDGWILRNEIVWHKPSVMPESVRDRCTRDHEMVYLFTKRPQYWCDMDAVRETASDWGDRDRSEYRDGTTDPKLKQHGLTKGDFSSIGRNKRTVWTIPAESNTFGHFATFPGNLIEPMINAGCPQTCCTECGKPFQRVKEATEEYARVLDAGASSLARHREHEATQGKQAAWGNKKARITAEYLTLGFVPTCKCNSLTGPGLVFDPFMGSGTTALVARRLGRDFIGCDLNPDYVAMANNRLSRSDPMQDRIVEPGFVQRSIFGEDK